MKKVLFFIESLHCGGAEKSLLSLLNTIDHGAYEISLMVLKRGGEFEELVPKDIKIQHIDVAFGVLSRFKFRLLRLLDFKKTFHPAQLFWQSFGRRIANYHENYDVAIAWGQGFSTYYVAEKVKANKKFAWVNTDYKKAGYYWKRDVAIYDKFDKVIGISDFVRTNMEEFIPRNKVMTINNIIDAEEVKSRALEETDIRFDKSVTNLVSVGRLVNHKAFELAIGAGKYLKKSNVQFHLYIIGEGTERFFLEEEIKRHELTSSCTLLGFRENPYPYINGCDIYVQTSRLEGLGRTIIEAGILCKPIVTTNFPTAFAILQNEKTGLITDMDSESIAKCIERLINDKALNDSLVSNLKKQKNKNKEETITAVYSLFNA